MVRGGSGVGSEEDSGDCVLGQRPRRVARGGSQESSGMHGQVPTAGDEWGRFRGVRANVPHVVRDMT